MLNIIPAVFWWNCISTTLPDTRPLMVDKRIITSHEVFYASSLFFQRTVQCQLRKILKKKNNQTILLYIYLRNCRYLNACTPVETSFVLGSSLHQWSLVRALQAYLRSMAQSVQYCACPNCTCWEELPLL